MRLLFDQNLSFKLCSRLAGLFPDSSQVRLLGLSEADDRVVWEHAKANGFTWFRRIRISPTLRHWSARHPKSSGYALGTSQRTPLNVRFVTTPTRLCPLSRT